MSESFLPIIYVRGYAALQSEVNATVDDPFYGFNLGSTHVRVNAKGDPAQFFFESPLVRLLTDYGYRDAFEGPYQVLVDSLPVAERRRTVWIFRYYDETADTYDQEGRRWSIEEAATNLRQFIKDVKKQTKAPQVHLVAHSMGGLVCRSLLQKIYPDAGELGATDVARFATYGTPHGGIQFRTGLGALAWIRDAMGAMNSDDFGRERMYQYLTPKKKTRKKVPDDFEQNAIDPAVFNPDNIFCIIGTNAHDYDAAAGGAKTLVGPQSDGLVRIGAAYVKGAHRAYVHRSHSGRYGIVNSEEGFQNLERFLFGDVQAIVNLEGVQDLPGAHQESYQVDVRVSVRGLPVFMNEQTREHFCPIILNDDDEPVPMHPVFTQFLNTGLAPDGSPARFAVNLAVKRLRMTGGEIDYDGLLHGVPTWTDTLIADVKVGAKAAVLSRWSLQDGDIDPQPQKVVKQPDGAWRITIPLPAGKAQELLGKNAKLVITAYAWSID
jgi:pimeloyl-ACP methyl ester carboxylesterase